MSQDEVPDAGLSEEAGEARQQGGETPAPKKRPRTWARLILVALVAAVLGAAASANWHDMPFSLIFGAAELKAGVVIICSAALGFILGVVFLWSALNRQ